MKVNEKKRTIAGAAKNKYILYKRYDYWIVVKRSWVIMENKPVNIGQNSIMNNFVKTDDILKDMRGIIETS